MSFGINVGGVWKQASPRINVGGVWKTPQAIYANVAGVWKQVWSALSAALSSYSMTLMAAATATTFASNTCSVSGNTGAPTYSWTLTNTGGVGTFSILSGQGTATVSVRVTGVSAGFTATATLTCTVSADGNTATSPACSLSFTNTSGA